MATMKRKKISDQLRKIILTCGESRYGLWKKTGIDQATLSHFISGRRSLTLKNLDTLAEYLDLELTVGKSKRKGK
jgi:hypothetical protein